MQNIRDYLLSAEKIVSHTNLIRNSSVNSESDLGCNTLDSMMM